MEHFAGPASANEMYFAGSSNGRTQDSESCYLGSNPGPAANEPGEFDDGEEANCFASVLIRKAEAYAPSRRIRSPAFAV